MHRANERLPEDGSHVIFILHDNRDALYGMYIDGEFVADDIRTYSVNQVHSWNNDPEKDASNSKPVIVFQQQELDALNRMIEYNNKPWWKKIF